MVAAPAPERAQSHEPHYVIDKALPMFTIHSLAPAVRACSFKAGIPGE
jgi:hypothetical protein